MDLLAKIKAKNPLIYNITNDVVANFSANGLLAIGASPVMANALQEAEDFAKHADAVILNVGTLTKDKRRPCLLLDRQPTKKGYQLFSIRSPLVLHRFARMSFTIFYQQLMLQLFEVTLVR